MMSSSVTFGHFVCRSLSITVFQFLNPDLLKDKLLDFDEKN